MKIAVDAMGGDFAPQAIVRGAVDACREFGAEVILVGDEAAINRQLQGVPQAGLKLEIHHASEVIAMDEHPASAVRRKKDSSLVVANRLVGQEEAQAVVSMGNSGAAMTASLFGLGRIEGVLRPALASFMPTRTGVGILLDAGANADCEPENLLQFAVMGSIYAQKVLGVASPRVGLVSIGEEETKGNKLTIESHRLLKESGLNFVGNIEGRDIHQGVCDVIVCDGFVGNVVLKLSEGLSSVIFGLIKEGLQASPGAKLGGLMVKGVFKKLKSKLDYTEYGGVPLLGLNGVSIIGHGRSNAKAVKNAIKAAMKAMNETVVAHIAEAVATRR